MRITTTLVNVVSQNGYTHAVSYNEYFKMGNTQTPAHIVINSDSITVSAFLDKWVILLTKNSLALKSEGLQVISATCANDYQNARNKVLAQISAIFEGRF